MKNVKVGDDWVTVVPGYVQAESEFCGDLMTEWFAQNFEEKIDEELRQKILDKRVEFYHLYEEGKVTIKQKQKTVWEKIKLWITNTNT